MKVRLPNNGGGNMNQMLRQAQQMQQDMQNLQADLEEREFKATSGGGMVEVTVDGKHFIKSIKINPDAIDPDDSEMLEDLITVAVNEAISNAIKEKDGNLVGNMASQGTTPRQLTDLIGSLCDLTSGSGDKGTPFILIVLSPNSSIAKPACSNKSITFLLPCSSDKVVTYPLGLFKA